MEKQAQVLIGNEMNLQKVEDEQYEGKEKIKEELNGKDKLKKKG